MHLLFIENSHEIFCCHRIRTKIRTGSLKWKVNNNHQVDAQFDTKSYSMLPIKIFNSRLLTISTNPNGSQSPFIEKPVVFSSKVTMSNTPNQWRYTEIVVKNFQTTSICFPKQFRRNFSLIFIRLCHENYNLHSLSARHALLLIL